MSKTLKSQLSQLQAKAIGGALSPPYLGIGALGGLPQGYASQSYLAQRSPTDLTFRQSLARDIFIHMLSGLMEGRSCAVQPIEEMEEQTAKAAVRAADALIRELEK